MSKKHTQAEDLMQYAKEVGEFTRYDAMLELGIANVTAVISDLRKKGVNVVADIRKTKNRYNRPVRYAVWHIEEDNDCGNKEFSN
jgi:uncharacterized UPF0146 family protein